MTAVPTAITVPAALIGIALLYHTLVPGADEFGRGVDRRCGAIE
ncbi:MULTISPECIES: hypothetical protein [unclassified Natrinema]|nr:MULTISPECIES: hypothetical protein [unclassified Natrinema]AFO59392.1 hypothetical protein NJ7G_4178 [Natrinema sp. J7-2]